jgi:trypsin
MKAGRVKWLACALASCATLAALPAPAGAQVAPRIVGGQTTTTNTYPWQAALVLDSTFGLNDFQGQFCGGSLITPRIVQTAAHCVHDTDPDSPPPDPGGDGTDKMDPNDLDIVLGKTTLTAAGGERRDVQKIYEDPSFSPISLENDFAWIVLSAASGQTPIKVAGAGETALWQPGRLTQTSGWGTTSEAGPSSNTLRVVTVPTISDTVCGQPSIYGSEFDAMTMVCAGLLGGGVDSCQGDSGGPLQAPAANTGGDPPFRLVGIVSWGFGCARPNAPGVYSRLADYAGGIQAKIDDIETLEMLPDAGAVTGAGATPPPLTNDAFATPQVISAGSSVIANNLDATAEGGEPAHGGAAGGHSVWYSWTAPSAGMATVSLCGSNFDTTLGVYTGDAVNALTVVAGNDDACGASSQSTFTVTAGTNYRIAVDGFVGDTGAFRLALSHVPDPPPPPQVNPPVQTVPPPPTVQPRSDPFAKCRKIRSKRKRKKCIRRVRATL